MLNKQQIENVQWECVHFVSQSDVQEINDFASIDVGENETKETFLNKLSEALSFPDYFGGNWDAAYDCLKDMEWLPKERYVLIINNASSLLANNQKLVGDLIEIWLSAAEVWSKEEKPFHLILVIDES